ncbi:MAG TPA: histidine kinase [Terriglobales bacterium]|nr:histidine kinase [Terriglobales bacterium]
MHPILARGRRLPIYLAAWIPIAVLLTLLLIATRQLAPARAIELALPLAFLYAFICLGVWYTCRVLPLSASSLNRTLGAQLTAALTAGALWAGAAWLLGVANPGGVWGLGTLLYLLAVAGYYLEIGGETAQRERALARDAELRALRAQINPHFLYNSLNSISALTSIDPLLARQMCVGLGDFLRRTLGLGERSTVRLAEELELIEAYVAIERVRFADRLQFCSIIAPEALLVTIPPLLLQPLVENAVVHGIAHCLAGGMIELKAEVEADRLLVSVTNPFDAEARRGGAGLGMDNVRRRLGAAGTMTTETTGELFTVKLNLPVHDGGDE